MATFCAPLLLTTRVTRSPCIGITSGTENLCIRRWLLKNNFAVKMLVAAWDYLRIHLPACQGSVFSCARAGLARLSSWRSESGHPPGKVIRRGESAFVASSNELLEIDNSSATLRPTAFDRLVLSILCVVSYVQLGGSYYGGIPVPGRRVPALRFFEYYIASCSPSGKGDSFSLDQLSQVLHAFPRQRIHSLSANTKVRRRANSGETAEEPVLRC